MSIVDHQTVAHSSLIWTILILPKNRYPFTFESLDLGSEVSKNGF